jgi:hypothetical protein
MVEFPRGASSMIPGKSFLKTVPRKSSLAFLLGVFLIFSTVGLATDIAEFGRAE